ncbi:putative six-bladed beta-propeller-like protein [Daldinia childiae]|uniref:putative six-bladed beta-propeller-like protein n=1 Tax=Daldinia childiae TaxID=326645 RepID=UPI001447FC6D|nr:putative six-bladed beta-propeller-like protein [Daldinia childiae]KAF3065968.1 putative six-bladed beta-propeller-like protein [Daldinia childiae]
MASKLIRLIGLIGAFAPALGVSIKGLRQISPPLSSRIIARMNQSDAFVENIAVRSNGDLVVTLLNPSASVYTVKEPYTDYPIMSLVHTFDGANGTIGISETSPDTFVVVAALIQDAARPLPNTTSLWELKLGDGDQQATARRMVHIPEAGLINGIISVPDSDSIILAADSQLGVIFRVDVATSEYEVILDTPELKFTPGASIQLGVNGLKGM